MNDDLRRFNGGARKGAGRRPTVHGYRQVAVRLPEDMAKWVLRQSVRLTGGSEAEFLRTLVRTAMDLEKGAEDSAKQSDRLNNSDCNV